MLRLVALVAALTACDSSASKIDTVLPISVVPSATTGPGDSWITGDTDQKFAKVAKHLRGLDVAMVEIGYRYGELSWAGRDQNWPFAAYQLDKISLALSQAVERRPKRAASAAMLDPALQAVKRAVGAKDSAGFQTAFETLTQTCNTCHATEQVPFMKVAPPQQRSSPIVAP